MAGTQLDCSGIVSGSAINSFTVIDGNDTGNSVGDKVEMLPTAAWGQDLADALTSTHNRSGGLKSGLTITTPTIVTPTLTNPTSTNPTLNSPTFGGTATGALTSAVLSNPYKFLVYLSSSYGSFPNASQTKVNLTAKAFDTGTNFDVATNYRFTAPIAGFYWFAGSVNFALTANTHYAAYIVKNSNYANAGTLQGGELMSQNTTANAAATVSGIMQLAANDTVELWGYQSQGGGATVNGSTGTFYTFLSGFLVSST